MASQASWEEANVRIDTHGGYGFLDKYDVVREFREARLYTVAPINTSLVLAYFGQRVLELPRSYKRIVVCGLECAFAERSDAVAGFAAGTTVYKASPE